MKEMEVARAGWGEADEVCVRCVRCAVLAGAGGAAGGCTVWDKRATGGLG
jgi:hypothetical protein